MKTFVEVRFFSIGIVEDLYQVSSKVNLCAIESGEVRTNDRKISIDIVESLLKTDFSVVGSREVRSNQIFCVVRSRGFAQTVEKSLLLYWEIGSNEVFQETVYEGW